MKSVPRTPLESWVKARIGLPADRDLDRRCVEAWQLEKIRATLDYVKRRSPFYRQRFAAHDPRSVQCPEDLAQWPLTTAEDLCADPLAFLCISQSKVERVVTLRARSAAERPGRLFFSAADLELAVDFFHHSFSTMLRPKQRMLVLMPCRSQYSVGDLLCRGLSRLSVAAVAHGPMQSSEDAVDAVLREHIDCLVGVPSELATLARCPDAARIPAGQIESVWIGTENSRRALVKEIERFWNCPTIEHYGSAEICPGGGVQCLARNGFHLREADVFIEIVNPATGRPVADGSPGEVVATTLTREAMPLVRFRTSRMAAALTAPCPCGSGLRRLTPVFSGTSYIHHEEHEEHEEFF